VQLLPIESFYEWKDSLEKTAELLLLVKTRTSLFDATIEAIKSIHPYETPEIAGTEFSAGLPEYFSWIASATR